MSFLQIFGIILLIAVAFIVYVFLLIGLGVYLENKLKNTIFWDFTSIMWTLALSSITILGVLLRIFG